MPRISKYLYPIRSLDECVKHLEIVMTNSPALSFRREDFADALDMSPQGGGFGALVGAMMQYGLVSTGDGYIRISELGKIIVKGEVEEKPTAKTRAVRSVRLFAELYDAFPKYDDKKIRLYLRQKGADIDEATRLAPEIRKLLNKNQQYRKPDAANVSGGAIDSLSYEDSFGFENKLQFTTPLYQITLANEKVIDQAISLLEHLKQQLTLKAEQKKPQPIKGSDKK